jgi:hypothetical protein
VVLQVLSHDIRTVDAEAVVVGFHDDVRPLKGGAGVLDWVLCGALSRLIIDGHVRGAAGDVALLTNAGKLPARMVFMIGLGSSAAAAPEALHLAARSAAAGLIGAGVRRAALDLFPLIAEPGEQEIAEVRQGLTEGSGGRELQITLLAQDAAAVARISRSLRA